MSAEPPDANDRNERDPRKQSATLSLVIPVYNEEDTIDLFMKRVDSVFSQVSDITVELVFVNDGSTDRTLELLLAQQRSDERLKIVDLSRNFGKEAALTAGLHTATGDAIVPIDVDLQDPPELVVEMIARWRNGFEVVVARRIDRESDGWPKRTSAKWFYWLHNKISDPTIPENVGDYRLMDRCVVEALRELPESRRFMKGLFAWVGFRTAHVDYVRAPRAAGSSKFHGWRLWNFALEGITSFSTEPLRIWTYVGAAVSMVSFAFAVVIAVRVILQGIDVPGYASLMVAVTFIGGMQLVGIGVIGEYLGRTYIEAKRRPAFLIRRIYHKE